MAPASYCRKDGTAIGHIPFLKDVLLDEAMEALHTQSTSFKNYVSDNQNFSAFIEIIKPPVSIIIIGAGNDVLPLAGMADILGWETTIIDGRANYAKKERFSNGCRVLLSKPEHVLEQITIDEQTVFFIDDA